LIFLAFIVPVAIYLFVLAVVNRSKHPVMVSGTWDFAGVLFAASGFLLVGGPAILSGLHEQWRLSWVLSQTQLLNPLGENWYFWISLWGIYLAAVVGGAALLVRRRRNQTSIYNIEPAVLERVLLQVFDRLGLEGRRGESRRIVLCQREAVLSEQKSGRRVLAEEPGCLGGLDVEWFPAMRHMTLHWLGMSDRLRQEMESELAMTLAEIETLPNPVSTWFLSLGIGLFMLVFVGLSVTAIVWVRLMAR
jgi:hypothetical protein